MKLTDEEKRAVREKVSKASGEWHFDLMLFAAEIEREVLAKTATNESLLNSLLECVSVPDDATVCDKFNALQKHWYTTARDDLAKAWKQKAIDENANDRGEPDAIYLQIHDPVSFDDTEKDDFRADGVTWCWHEINHNDVRYIREDLAHPLPAIPEGWQLVPVEPTQYQLHEAYDNHLMEPFSRQSTGHEVAKRIYRTMMSASPKP